MSSSTTTTDYAGEGASALTIPTNMALLIMAQAQDAQRHGGATDEAKQATDKLYDHFERFVDNCVRTDDPWGNFRGPFSDIEREAEEKQNEEAVDVINHPASAAAFVHAFLVATTGASIVGGVSDTRFHYEEMRTRVDRSRNMPCTWRGVKIDHLGGVKKNAFVMNDVPYVPK